MKQVKVDRAFYETGESWQVAWWNGWKLIWPQTKRVKVDMDMRKTMRKFTSFLTSSNPVCSLVWHPEDFYYILTVIIHMGFRFATSECFEIHLWDSLLQGSKTKLYLLLQLWMSPAKNNGFDNVLCSNSDKTNFFSHVKEKKASMSQSRSTR